MAHLNKIPYYFYYIKKEITMWTVYSHTNKITGNIYIGITSTKPKIRWGCKGSKYKDSPKFWNAIQKYGWDNFEHTILFENLSEDEAKAKEIELISTYKRLNISYNISNGGDGVTGIPGSMTGKKHKDQTKLLISKKLKGRISPMKGHKLTDEHKKKIGDANRGKPMPQHIRKKLLECHLGIKLSDDIKRKMSEAHKGKPHGPMSEDHKRKLSEAHKGKSRGPMSEETKRKISAARKGQQIGRKLSDEWRQHVSEGVKKFWENKNKS